ncbi:MAG: flavodoxin family protein [Chloroflexota bacterium]
MKILIINFDNPGHASLNLMIDAFVSGAEGAGAECVRLNVHELKINPCLGCTDDLFFSSDGECRQHDDMISVYPHMRSSEAWIFAFSLNNEHAMRQLRNLLDRLEPLMNVPFKTNGNGSKHGKVALLSVTEDWNVKRFTPVVELFKTMSGAFEKELVGEMLRPHCEALVALRNLHANVQETLDAVREAGAEVVTQERINPETLKNIQKELISEQSFINELLVKTKHIN